MTFFSDRSQILLFMHLEFTNDLISTRLPLTLDSSYTCVLFLRDSSLQKQSFIAADFRSSLHIFNHHCTFSYHCTFRSSLHIFVHHCTFCTSLHVKTSPGGFDLPSHCAQRHRRSLSFITSAAQQRHRSLFIWTLEGGNTGCSCILVKIG